MGLHERANHLCSLTSSHEVNFSGMTWDSTTAFLHVVFILKKSHIVLGDFQYVLYERSRFVNCSTSFTADRKSRF